MTPTIRYTETFKQSLPFGLVLGLLLGVLWLDLVGPVGMLLVPIVFAVVAPAIRMRFNSTDVTDAALVVRRAYRPALTMPWPEIVGIDAVSRFGARRVCVRRANGEVVVLPAPLTAWWMQDLSFDEKYRTIGETYLARRGPVDAPGQVF